MRGRLARSLASRLARAGNASGARDPPAERLCHAECSEVYAKQTAWGSALRPGMAGARRAEGPAHGIRDTESGAVFGSPGAPCSLHATQARHPFESVSSNSLPRGAASARAAVDAALASRPPAAAAGPSGAQLSRAYSSGSGVTFQSVPAEFIGPPEADAKRHAPDVDPKAVSLFEAAWQRLQDRHGRDRLVFPREVVWLNGAPGAGKGTHTSYVLQIRGLSRAVVMSDLLDGSDQLKAIKDSGGLIPDQLVLDVLLDAIFAAPDADNIGLIVDGYPRTSFQADLLKLLYDRMMEVHEQHKRLPDLSRYPRPLFKVVVLYIDEQESIKRQTARAQSASERNRRILDAGVGRAEEVRATDVDIEKAQQRYLIFKQHYGTLLRLMQHFPFCLIDAMGSLESCQQQIAQELRYQSSLDLLEGTYRALAHLPLAKEVVTKSRQSLVQRLDRYYTDHRPLLDQVVSVIEEEVLPGVLKSSLAGFFEYTSTAPFWDDQPLACEVLIDVLSDRGFKVSHRTEVVLTPSRVDLTTGAISCTREARQRFRIAFETENIRSYAQSRLSEQKKSKAKAANAMNLGGMVIPPSHDHQSSATQQFARQLEESLSAIGKRGVGGHSDVGGKPMWLERVGRGERRGEREGGE